jgi:hypothetical protein
MYVVVRYTAGPQRAQTSRHRLAALLARRVLDSNARACTSRNARPGRRHAGGFVWAVHSLPK